VAGRPRAGLFRDHAGAAGLVAAFRLRHRVLPNEDAYGKDDRGVRDTAVISKEDCIALCGLDADEVAAIAEHEHIGEVAAAALANYLLHRAGGPEQIRTMIVSDIRQAFAAGRTEHARELFMALRHFLEHHPEAR
jgi:hypothetical protein